MKKLIFSFLVLQLFCLNASSQVKDIYFFYERYTKEMQETLRNGGYKTVKLLTKSNILGSDGKISNNQVKKGLTKILSEKVDLLVIDWEEDDFWDLKKRKGSREFKEAESKFVHLVNLIKAMFPNQKVGIYGLPFKVYENKNPSYNEKEKFDKLFSIVDVICPSVYFGAPNKQYGKARNYRFLENQLDVALDYGRRLNMPVIPFIWEVVHPSNKIHGGELISKEEFKEKVQFISNHRYNNQDVAGMIWWAPGAATKGHYVEKRNGKSNRYNANINRSAVTKSYLDYLEN